MNYIILLFIISLLIIVHECGHFYAAQKMGIAISRFSLGFGPKLWSFKYGDTEFRVSLFLFGGYVLPNITSLDDLFEIPYHKRIIFALGGPVANILIGIFLTIILVIIQYVFSVSSTFPFFEGIQGIIGVIANGDQIIDYNIANAFYFSIILSFNLAIFNLLPIPPLDGGQVLMYTLQKLFHRVKTFHFQLQMIGWILMIALVIAVNINDSMTYLNTIT